jgi:S1-C subfamily serine protease
MFKVGRVIVGVILFVFAVIPLKASSWPFADKLMESVVYLETGTSACTGSVIDSQKHYILTAAHCDGEDLYADQSPAKIVSKDVKSDLMVISVEDLNKPAIKLAAHNPAIGEEVASIGYGYGLERPMFRVAHVSDNKAEAKDLNGQYIMLDTAFVPGQSGGPVVNANGELIAIIQLASDRIGLGKGAEQIKSKVGKYFAHP